MLWWEESLATGNELIDEQHKSIFDQVENILSLEPGVDSTTLEKTLKFLIGYVATHFDDEENMMMENDYPALEKHREEHAYFTNELYNVVKEVINAGRMDQESSDSIRLLVIEWLVKHIHGSDRNFVNFLQDL